MHHLIDTHMRWIMTYAKENRRLLSVGDATEICGGQVLIV